MELETQFTWLPKAIANGKAATIKGVVKIGRDVIVYVQMEGKQYQFSIWGQLQNKLIDRFGKDTDKWTDQNIQFKVEEQINTGKRILHVL